MVRGFGIAVTAVALMYQCAETTRMARGRGTDEPKLRHAWVYRLSSKAFIGLPCPRNAAGIRSVRAAVLMLLLRASRRRPDASRVAAAVVERHITVVRSPSR
jgi:hypothetical protein